MSLISRLKAVVAGDEYLDDDFDELDYGSEDEFNEVNDFKQNQKLKCSYKFKPIRIYE